MCVCGGWGGVQTNNNLSANKASDEEARKGDETFGKNVEVSGDKMVAGGWMV